MAIKFNIKKYEQIKAEYVTYLKTGNASAISLRNFESYKMYLDADDEVKQVRECIRIQKKKQEEAKIVSKEKPKQAQKEEGINEQMPQHFASNRQKKAFQHWLNQIQARKEGITGTEYYRILYGIRHDIRLSQEQREVLHNEAMKRKIKIKYTKSRSRNYREGKHSKRSNHSHHSGGVSSFYSCTYASRPISNYKK